MRMLTMLMLLSASSQLSVSAATIPGLFNTGVDGAGVALAGGDGVTDPHWMVVGGSNALTFFRPGDYLAENSGSRWVNPNGVIADPGPSYVLRLQFDLTGFQVATATINGNWGADNCGLVRLNGGPPSGDTTGDCGNAANFQSLTPFSFSSGFVEGINTLELDVVNFGDSSAARVDNLTGTAAAVPEPASLMMAGLCLVALGVTRRRWKVPGPCFLP